jgi:hypothetical protein
MTAKKSPAGAFGARWREADGWGRGHKQTKPLNSKQRSSKYVI